MLTLAVLLSCLMEGSLCLFPLSVQMPVSFRQNSEPIIRFSLDKPLCSIWSTARRVGDSMHSYWEELHIGEVKRERKLFSTLSYRKKACLSLPYSVQQSSVSIGYCLLGQSLNMYNTGGSETRGGTTSLRVHCPGIPHNTIQFGTVLTQEYLYGWARFHLAQ